MLRTIDVVERNVIRIPYPIQVVGTGAIVDILPDSTGQVSDANNPIALNRYELAYIEIMNCAAIGSGLNVYYNFGTDADARNASQANNSYCGYIQPGNSIRVRTRQRVSIYNPSGATAVPMAVTILRRRDMDSDTQAP